MRSTMSLKFGIANFSHEIRTIELSLGTSTFFVGANGSGKTRLAAQAEKYWGEQAHRISGHRALNLNPTVTKISEHKARIALRFGNPEVNAAQGPSFRNGGRWKGKGETILLDDFDFLVQALFADQSNIALQTHNAAHAGNLKNPQQTCFQILTAIWNRIVPDRILQITGDDIKVFSNEQPLYSAADMSDGERAIFYILGQILIAEKDSIIIFDEPELHLHRAILSRLWDEVEALRPDCAFLVITHDLEFAASRPGKKFVLRQHRPPSQWEIEEVPADTGFSDEITTLILGSRKPILFVEGTGSSLDLAIYRACYPNWTVLPRGACEDVIHAVATMRYNANLTHITCSGIVDADDYTEEDKRNLAKFGVSALPVSEIENIFLLPDVVIAILEEDKYQGEEIQIRLNALTQAVIEEVRRPGAIDRVVHRYCRRRIDRTLKKTDLTNTKTIAELAEVYTQQTTTLNINAIAQEARERIEAAIEKNDLPTLLANFDDKALLALAAKHLKGSSKNIFESWLTRSVRDTNGGKIKSALENILPIVTAY